MGGGAGARAPENGGGTPWREPWSPGSKSSLATLGGLGGGGGPGLDREFACERRPWFMPTSLPASAIGGGTANLGRDGGVGSRCGGVGSLGGGGAGAGGAGSALTLRAGGGAGGAPL